MKIRKTSETSETSKTSNTDFVPASRLHSWPWVWRAWKVWPESSRISQIALRSASCRTRLPRRSGGEPRSQATCRKCPAAKCDYLWKDKHRYHTRHTYLTYLTYQTCLTFLSCLTYLTYLTYLTCLSYLTCLTYLKRLTYLTWHICCMTYLY